ncbi:MAG: PEGA domain-containing protein, partial [bacterium]
NETPQPPSHLNPDLSPQMDELVFWLLSKNISERPADTIQVSKRISVLFSDLDCSHSKSKLAQLIQKNYHPKTDISKYIPPKNDGKKSGPIPPKKFISRKWLYILVSISAAAFIYFLLWMAASDKKDSDSTSEFIISDSNRTDIMNHQQPDTSFTFSVTGELKNSTLKGSDPNNMPQKIINRQNDEEIIRKEPAVAADSGYISENNSRDSISAMETLQSFIELDIEPWGILSIDGVLVDSFAHVEKFELAAGMHQFIIAHPSFPPKILDLKILPGQSRSISYSFIEYCGFLTIEVRPWADVYIDGKLVDSTPLARPIILAEGQHILELRHPAFQKYRQEISILAGDTLVMRKTF